MRRLTDGLTTATATRSPHGSSTRPTATSASALTRAPPLWEAARPLGPSWGQRALHRVRHLLRLAKDRPRGPDETYADYLGISVFSSEPLAIENAVRWPKHVAAVVLPESERFSIARTYPEIEGHYSVWGDPERLLANVQGVSTHLDPGKLHGP